MKLLLISLVLSLTFSAKANSSIREQCENAYYATGYVKLHEYQVTVDWARLSDHGLVEFEDVIFGDYFQYLGERDLSNGKTVYTIKEKSGFDSYYYEVGLNVLQRLTFQGVRCRYDLP